MTTTVKQISLEYIQDTVATETLTAQLSLNDVTADLDSIYDSFCKIVNEHLERRLLTKNLNQGCMVE